ncbi:MAG: sialidase family protein [Acidobacteriota bacterium]
MANVKALALCAAVLVLAGCDRAPVPVSASFDGRDPTLRWDASGGLDVVYVEDRPEGAAIVHRRLGSGAAGPFTVSPAQPEIKAGKETPPTLERLPGGALVVAYPVSLPGMWKGEILTRRSADGGRTWGTPIRLHPRRDGSHSLVSSTATPSGAVFAWLDNRSGHMGLQSAFTSDGRSFTEPASSPDPETCQCCGTTLLAGAGGEVWLAYRDLEAGDLRDFKVLRSRATPPAFGSGTRLSSDGWHIQGCPETGARLAQAGDGTLWAAWFTVGGKPGVYVTSSSDGGASFAPRTLVSDPDRAGWHPEIGVLPDGRAAVFYETLDDGGEPAVFVRIRGTGGDWGAPVRLLAEAAYPRFASRNGRAALAVTCRGTKRIVVREWASGDPKPGGPGGETVCKGSS